MWWISNRDGFSKNTMTFTGVDTSQGYRRQNTEVKLITIIECLFIFTKKLKEHEFSLSWAMIKVCEVGKGFSNLRQGLYSPEVLMLLLWRFIVSANHNEMPINLSFQD
jgi:hypothetical protein